jgi:hypothetical protein
MVCVVKQLDYTESSQKRKKQRDERLASGQLIAERVQQARTPKRSQDAPAFGHNRDNELCKMTQGTPTSYCRGHIQSLRSIG